MLMILLFFSAPVTFSMNNTVNKIEPLNGNNYKRWKEDIELALGLLDIDMAINEDEPVLNDESTNEEKAYHKEWTKANRKALMLIKRSIDESLVKAIPKFDNAKTFLESVGERYEVSEKAEAEQLMHNFTNMKYDGVGGVRQHIMKMMTIANRLADLECPIADKFLVYHALNSLPNQFNALKTSYHAQLQAWDINTLISVCAQEESRMNHVTSENVNLVSQPHHKKHFKKRGNKFQGNNGAGPSQKPFGQKPLGPKPVFQKPELKCWFCKMIGHKKSNCIAFKSFLEKKGKGESLAFVCFESSLVDVPLNSWWIDSGASIHVANSLQGFKDKRKPSDAEINLFVGNGNKVDVQFIGTVELKLKSGFILCLKDTVYVPSMRRNLISLSKLDDCDFAFNFSNGICLLSYDSKVVGKATKFDGLYRLNLDSNVFNSLHVQCIGTKRAFIKENSFSLWHRRLGHISKERIDRLIKDEVLPSLDYKDLEQCVDCIRGKLAKTNRKGSTRSRDLLEIIHTDICGPLKPTLCENKYFITFIDDFSRFGYVYLINEKSQSLEKFKIFKTEVENQCGKSIKVVRSDRGGEFYGRHGETGQLMGPFAKYLEDYGIVSQFTMPGTPEQNGVAER